VLIGMGMPIRFEISVVQVGKSLKITIPIEVAKHLRIKKGDVVDLWVDNNHMIVEKKV
jgi:bifunctional DNA-binding transcriptional regulator/antitoxin component of YhaV-PrlF toxin-antitoxin module